MASTTYVYGMRLRGFSLGCQPMQGFVERKDDPTSKYHDLLVYDRKLTDKELADYELDTFMAQEMNHGKILAELLAEHAPELCK